MILNNKDSKRISALLTRVIVLTMVCFFVISCQEEIDIIEGTDPNGNNDTNNFNSETTDFFRRISMHDGSYDDVMDSNFCSSVVLPVSLTANNIPLLIESTADLVLIENVFNQSSIDEDVIVFDFPIQVMNYDYTIQTIASEIELALLRSDCNELILNEQAPITCVDFIYDLGFSIFNSNLNQSTILSVSSDFDLFNFIENLSVDEFYSAQYPIEVVVSGMQNTFINSDQELESTILNCLSNQQSQNPSVDLNLILTNTIWEVTSLVDNGVDITSSISGYEFDFENDFTIVVSHSILPIPNVNGIWSSNYLNNVTSLNLNLNNDPVLNLLNKDWEVTAVTNNQINLKWNDEIYLTFNSI